MFALFLPEYVVQKIIAGDQRMMRPHVDKREVTVMFSDIVGFTTICESLSRKELLFILTRYFSIMTCIIASFDGVVSEILGDGLLVYWNTPDDVQDHAAKASASALAQQHALEPLNAELAKLGLPELAIRIGMDTGQVLSGIIGCESKLKFGCIGDTINLASRIEGLCKFYKVGIICTEATYNALPASAGLFCRELDFVQVKGTCRPTRIYEIMGFSDCTDPCISEKVGCVMSLSSKALEESAVWSSFLTPIRRASKSMIFQTSRSYSDTSQQYTDSKPVMRSRANSTDRPFILNPDVCLPMLVPVDAQMYARQY